MSMDAASITDEDDYSHQRQAELKECLANGQWGRITTILNELFRTKTHMKSMTECVRALSTSDLFYDICKSANMKALKLLLDGNTSMNKYFLEFTIAMCEAHSMESIVQNFRQLNYPFRIALMRALTFTRQIGKLTRLIQHNFFSFHALDVVVECGYCDETIMAWITCCTSEYIIDKKAKIGMNIWPHCQSMGTLLMFGIWSNCLRSTHPCHIALKNSFRCQLLRGMRHPSFSLLGLLEKLDAKTREERLTDAVYMCIYANKLDVLKQILKQYSVNLFAFPFALHWAVRSRELTMVKFVSKKCPGQINSLCELGFTPLILAIFTGKVDVVKFLLRFKNIVTSLPSRHKLIAYDYAREFPEIEPLLRNQ